MGYVLKHQNSGMFKVFSFGLDDEISIRLKQGTKIYAYVFICISKGRL